MIELYFAPTPNGWKAAIMLEECGLPYQPHLLRLSEGDQFAPEFLAISPNAKIPAILDRDPGEEWGPEPVPVFESGAILIYLAEKFGAFLPASEPGRAECMSWLMWQMGSAPYLGGGFGHFYAYAPEKWEYPINRYAMEVKRLLDVLDQRLADNQFLCGDEYTIADMANYAWFGALVLHNIYDASKFLDVASYTNVVRWATQIEDRPAVQRGRRVNRPWGPEETQVRERHSAADFEIKSES